MKVAMMQTDGNTLWEEWERNGSWVQEYLYMSICNFLNF
jgi:hypothetical protein